MTILLNQKVGNLTMFVFVLFVNLKQILLSFLKILFLMCVENSVVLSIGVKYKEKFNYLRGLDVEMVYSVFDNDLRKNAWLNCCHYTVKDYC